MNEIIIEKGITIPSRRESKWPLLKMEIGDSFSFPEAKVNSVRISVQKAKAANFRFTIRTIDQNTSRCWRVK